MQGNIQMDPRACCAASEGLRGVGVLALWLALAAGTSGAAGVPLPQRNLVVQVRLIGAAGAARGAVDDAPRASVGNPGYTVGTRQVERAWPHIQTLHVQNGQKGYLRFTNALPIQWVEAIGTVLGPSATGAIGTVRGAGNSAAPDASSGAASGKAVAGAGVSGVAVTDPLTWIEAGQSLVVKPSWAGGKALVSLEIEVVTQRIGTRDGGALPQREQSQTRTTLVVPLGKWTTFASVDEERRASTPGVWSTDDADSEEPQVFQVQVLAP